MKTENKSVLILNLTAAVLFIIPAFRLNLFYENYSTLSLNTKGYFYLLFLGISLGILLSYEMYFTLRKYSIWMFAGLFMGTIIPHHVPYNLQGNLHLIFAYIGFGIICASTYLNLYIHGENKIISIYVFLMFIVAMLYMKYSMINTLSEIIIMFTILLSNYYLFSKFSKNKR